MEPIKKENQPLESCIEESQKSHRCTVVLFKVILKLLNGKIIFQKTLRLC